MQVSVIVSTYNQPEWLEKVLWGYNIQSFKEFELIVADDGSGKAMREVLGRLTPRLSYPLKHVWHEDRGFRKCEILNKAILAASTDYLVFTDGDCIPRKALKEERVNLLLRKEFLIPCCFSQRILKQTCDLISRERISREVSIDNL